MCTLLELIHAPVIAERLIETDQLVHLLVLKNWAFLQIHRRSEVLFGLRMDEDQVTSPDTQIYGNVEAWAVVTRHCACYHNVYLVLSIVYMNATIKDRRPTV